MEYLEGETLDAIINARSSLTMLAKINFICDVCQGLAYAHHPELFIVISNPATSWCSRTAASRSSTSG